MKIREENGIYGLGKVYTLESLEDWDKYEKMCKEKEPDFLKYHPSFYQIKEEFEEYFGRVWEDKKNLRYTLNGIPVYKTYFIIGIEDNDPWADWYWVLENVDDRKDIKYLLANSHELKEGLRY